MEAKGDIPLERFLHPKVKIFMFVVAEREKVMRGLDIRQIHKIQVEKVAIMVEETAEKDSKLQDIIIEYTVVAVAEGVHILPSQIGGNYIVMKIIKVIYYW